MRHMGEPPSRLRSIGALLTALIVPPLCAACKRATASDAALCGQCRQALASLPAGSVATRGGGAIAESFAAFPYEGVARELVGALKFKGAVALAREMAQMMVERAPTALVESALLVPAPAHPVRRRVRGFNQAALLAAEVSRLTGAPVWDCLWRSGGRGPQSTMSRTERLELPAGAVRCSESAPPASASRSAIEGESLTTKVVLLDDVSTTGVTLERCASGIRERHDVHIGALTFASTSAHPARFESQARTGAG